MKSKLVETKSKVNNTVSEISRMFKNSVLWARAIAFLITSIVSVYMGYTGAFETQLYNHLSLFGGMVVALEAFVQFVRNLKSMQ